MNYEQLLLSALSKADEEPGDEIIDKVVEDAVNHGYKLVATEMDPQIKSEKVEYNGEYHELPDDFHQVFVITNEDGQELSHNDYYVEAQRKLYITNKDNNKKGTNLFLRYVYVPEKLVEKEDEPITKDEYDYMIIMYGAYNVLLYKKRYNMADMMFQEFMRLRGGES